MLMKDWILNSMVNQTYYFYYKNTFYVNLRVETLLDLKIQYLHTFTLTSRGATQCDVVKERREGGGGSRVELARINCHTNHDASKETHTRMKDQTAGEVNIWKRFSHAYGQLGICGYLLGLSSLSLGL